MEFFCEKCNLLSEQDFCRYCGRKGLKTPAPDDFCFLTEVNAMFGAMFKGILDDEQISYADYPSGNGVRSQFALKLQNLRIYVVYQSYQKAKELLANIYENIEQAIRTDLQQNIEFLSIKPRTKKKIERKLSLPPEENVLEFCANLILTADKIDKRGRITGCPHGGEYIFILKDAQTLILNSATYEILSLE